MKNFSDEGFDLSRVKQLVVVLVVEIIESSEEPPKQTSESTVVILGWDNNDFLHWLQWF